MTKYWKNPSPLVAILLPAVLFLAGCAIKPGPPCSKGGMVYGRTVGIFQGGWDDYYERALSYMEGECYDAALFDLDAAIAQKDADRRMARTFGMHFVDYFPHREKGLVFYLTGNDEAALEELELSIEQEKSDKALFYRDKVRERIMRKKGVEASLPRVVITSPRMLPGDGQTAWTADDPVLVAGVAEDDRYVSEISLAGTPLFMDGSLRSAEFSEKLRLPQGRHEIEIVATNLLGRQGKEKFVLIVDRAGPALVVEQFVPGVAIAGYARDNAGVASVSLDGNSKPSSGEETVRFAFLLAPGTDTVRLTAADQLGNETVAVVGSQSRKAEKCGVWYAQAASGTSNGASDLSAVSLAGSSAEERPTISIDGWARRNATFEEKARIGGSVRSTAGIATVAINGVSVIENAGGQVFFHHVLLLSPGENAVEIRAEDEQGNVAVQRLEIVRSIPKVYRLENRYGVMIRSFSADAESLVAAPFQKLLIDDFIEAGRFRIALAENTRNTLGKSGGTATSPVLAGPQAKNLDSTMSGVVYETREGVEIVARLFDNASSERMTVENVYTESRDQEALRASAERMRKKFSRAFPLAVGTVSRSDRRMATAVIEEKLRMGWPMILYRNENPSSALPGTVVRGTDSRILGEAEICEISHPGYGVAVSEHCPNDIRPGDKVISK